MLIWFSLVRAGTQRNALKGAAPHSDAIKRPSYTSWKGVSSVGKERPSQSSLWKDSYCPEGFRQECIVGWGCLLPEQERQRMPSLWVFTPSPALLSHWSKKDNSSGWEYQNMLLPDYNRAIHRRAWLMYYHHLKISSLWSCAKDNVKHEDSSIADNISKTI